MDFSYLTIGVVVVLLGACLWLWRNREGSIQQGWRRLLARVRLGLGASSRQEVERINAQLTALAHQMEGRVKALENESLLSHQLQEFSRVIDRRLLQLEQAGSSSHPSREEDISRPRSILHYGLRFTLSEALWSYVGVKRLSDLGEAQFVTLIQGPFCRMCLKRMVGRDRGQSGTIIPDHCRFCGVPWNSHEAQQSPPTDGGLKREVYESLDEKWRAIRSP